MKKLIALLFLLLPALAGRSEEVRMTSPDGSYVVTLTDTGGQLCYAVDWRGAARILPSQLGVEESGHRWLEALQIGAVTESVQDTLWHPVYGERRTIRDRYRAYTVEILQAEHRGRLELDFRLYDEGVAFRYHFVSGGYLSISDEFTEFTMPEGTQAWYTARAQTPYQLLPLAGWPGESDRPLLCELPGGGYQLLGEARVVDYCRTKFRLADKPNTVATAMYGKVDEIVPYASPWRVVMCGETAGEILQHNDLLLNLNTPGLIEDPSWIRPGKVMRETTLSTEGAKELVDFAVKHRLQYIHFDTGWYGAEGDKRSDARTPTVEPRRNPNPDALNIEEVVRYARERGIGVILYVNQRQLQAQLDELLPLYKAWGIAGLKFGFVQVGSQMWTRWLHEAVKKCADYGMMVDIHDEYRPTGFSRTFPNLMTQEGIRGNEEFPDADHNCLLPFTRFTAGAADYTICYFRQDFSRFEQEPYGLARPKTVQTTPAHQLALAAVYYSPLQYMYWYDKPADAQDEPELKFFDDIPTVWDDTKIVQGEPGRHITVARRSGDAWFLGTITGNAGRRTRIALDFLEPGRSYVAEIYTDGGPSVQTRTKVRVRTMRVDCRSELQIDLRPSGGAAIRFVPETGRQPAVKNYKGEVL